MLDFVMVRLFKPPTYLRFYKAIVIVVLSSIPCRVVRTTFNPNVYRVILEVAIVVQCCIRRRNEKLIDFATISQS